MERLKAQACAGMPRGAACRPCPRLRHPVRLGRLPAAAPEIKIRRRIPAGAAFGLAVESGRRVARGGAAMRHCPRPEQADGAVRSRVGGGGARARLAVAGLRAGCAGRRTDSALGILRIGLGSGQHSGTAGADRAGGGAGVSTGQAACAGGRRSPVQSAPCRARHCHGNWRRRFSYKYF